MSSNYSKCLLIGANGFIGRSLIGHLTNVFDTVLTYSRSLSSEIEVEGVVNIVGDFFDSKLLSESLDGVDVVIHLVTTVTPATSNTVPCKDIEQNLLGSVRLLEMCKKKGVRKIIYLSSGGTVYGDCLSQGKIRETQPLAPTCSYGIVKVAIENYIKLFSQLYGIEYSILRISNPYGPLQDYKNSQGIIASFLKKIKCGEPLEIWGDGSSIRDYVYIDDVCTAILKSISYTGKEKVFNISSGDAISINQLLEICLRLYGKGVEVRYVSSKWSGVDKIELDNNLAITELNWMPKVTLVEGLRRVFLNKGLIDG